MTQVHQKETLDFSVLFKLTCLRWNIVTAVKDRNNKSKWRIKLRKNNKVLFLFTWSWLIPLLLKLDKPLKEHVFIFDRNIDLKLLIELIVYLTYLAIIGKVFLRSAHYDSHTHSNVLSAIPRVGLYIIHFVPERL